MRLGRIQNNYTAGGFDLVKNSGLDFIEICCNNAEEAANLVAAKDGVKATARFAAPDTVRLRNIIHLMLYFLHRNPLIN